MAILSLESHRERCVVVGEDLGIVPEEMRRALREYAVYSYSVMYFNHNDGNYWMPEYYHDQALAVVSTHDLAPLLGFWTNNDIETMNGLGVFETRRSTSSCWRSGGSASSRFSRRSGKRTCWTRATTARCWTMRLCWRCTALSR